MNGMHSGSVPHKIIALLFFMLLGVGVFFVALKFGEVPIKKTIGALIIAGIIGFAFISRHAKSVFLFALIFSLTYNRQYFVFNGIFPDSGQYGPYLIAADFFLTAILGIWVFERIFGKQSFSPIGNRIWLWYFPFAVACCLSIFAAERVDWAFFEMMRVVKVALLFFYLRYNLGKREWWICVAALGLALFTQSFLGSLEVITKRTGVLWLIGLGGNDMVVPDAFQQEQFYGMRRATGTMNHPPNLACYMLLTIPLFISLSLTAPRWQLRSLCACISLMGLIGLACTLSRWPWVMAAGQCIVLIIGLTCLQLISLKRALGLFVTSVFVLMLVFMVFSDKIIDRVNRDFGESVAQRARGINTAFQMFDDVNPLVGVGLNNYRVYLLGYEPELEWLAENEPQLVQQNTRFIAAPENGFLFVLAETGIFGFATFLLYLVGILRIGAQGVAASSGHWKGASLGLLVGILGVLGQQAIDYSYWIDPILYSFTLIAGMLNNAPFLSEQAIHQYSGERVPVGAGG